MNESPPVQEEIIQPEPGEQRIECPTCGRKFVEIAYEKHVKICKKVFVQKRKEFDVKEMRKPEGLEEI